MNLIGDKWFKADGADRDQQLNLERRLKSLKKELNRFEEKNTPTYWGVVRVIHRIGKNLKYTGSRLGVRFELSQDYM